MKIEILIAIITGVFALINVVISGVFNYKIKELEVANKNRTTLTNNINRKRRNRNLIFSTAVIFGLIALILIGLNYFGSGYSRPCDKNIVVYLHSAKSSNDKRAEEIIEELNKCGCRTEGTEMVDEITESMIKYFRASDKEKVNELTEHIFKQTGIKLEITYNSRYTYKVDKGYFEIWLK